MSRHHLISQVDNLRRHVSHEIPLDQFTFCLLFFIQRVPHGAGFFPASVTAYKVGGEKKGARNSTRPNVSKFVCADLKATQDGVNSPLSFLLPCGKNLLITLAILLAIVIELFEGQHLIQTVHDPATSKSGTSSHPGIAERAQSFFQFHVLLDHFACGFGAGLLPLFNRSLDEFGIRPGFL